MRSLLTGATGYVGSHLARTLRRDGHAVRALVDARCAAAAKCLAALSDIGVEVIETGSADPAQLAEACRDIDVVFNLPEPVTLADLREAGDSVIDCTFRVDVEAARALIEVCRISGVGRLVQSGTVQVYRQDDADASRTLREVDPAMDADAAAALDAPLFAGPNIAVETLIRDLLPPPDYAVLRSSVVYGAGCPFADAFVRLAARLGAVGGDPMRTVQWIHVTDLVGAMLRAAEATDPVNDTFNIAGPEAVSDAELWSLTQRIVRRFGRPYSEAAGAPSFTTLERRFDITKARERLGFEPEMPLAEGLEEMVAAVVLGDDWDWGWMQADRGTPGQQWSTKGGATAAGARAPGRRDDNPFGWEGQVGGEDRDSRDFWNLGA